MMYGVNTAVSAAVKKLSQHDYVTHNLANAQTPGYKAERLIFVRKPETDPMAEDSFSHDPVVLIDHAPGMLQKSGNPLDVAIQGEGYFAIETKDGERFTRNGSFTLNASGELVTQSGDAVMGEGGRITISGKKIEISNSGSISVDGSEAGKLKIVDFKKKDALVKRGNGLFEAARNAEQAALENPEVRSGYLETSNVQAVKEMVEMIDIQRSFEAYLKIMQTISDQDRMATSRVGKIY
ncbi:MAG: flagellar basal-body rod protein FlgF [Syntrophaceae bacterium]